MIVEAPRNPGKNQPSRELGLPGTENWIASGRPGKLCMLISVLVRCGLTIRYTKKPAIASVASTAKNTNARTADSSLMYQRIGRAWVCSSAKVTMKFGRPHEIGEIANINAAICMLAHRRNVQIFKSEPCAPCVPCVLRRTITCATLRRPRLAQTQTGQALIFLSSRALTGSAGRRLPNSGFESLAGDLLRRENKARQFAGPLYQRHCHTKGTPCQDRFHFCRQISVRNVENVHGRDPPLLCLPTVASYDGCCRRCIWDLHEHRRSR